jgi:hypothetical protein
MLIQDDVAGAYRPGVGPDRLPSPRGPLSAHLLEQLRRGPGSLSPLPPLTGVDDPMVDDDLNLALYLCYELHYRWSQGRTSLRCALPPI